MMMQANSPACCFEQGGEFIGIAIGKRQGRALQTAGHANRLNAIKEMRGQPLGSDVGGLVPVVPAVVAAKQHLVAAGDPARDPHRNGTGLAAALAVAHHFRRGHNPHQLLGQLHGRLLDDAVDRPPVDLGADRGIDDLVGIAQDHRPYGAGPIDVFVAIHIPDATAFGAFGVDGADTERSPGGPPADELGGAGDERFGALVDL